MDYSTLLIVLALFGAISASSKVSSDHRFRARCDQQNGTCVYTLRVRAGMGARDLSWFNATVRKLVVKLNEQRTELSGLSNTTSQLQTRVSAAEQSLTSQENEVTRLSAERNDSLTLIGRLDDKMTQLDSQLESILACKPCDFCRTRPCLNSGVCVPNKASFHCICRPGFSGERCQTQVTPCSSNPCLNNGKCTPTSQSAFRCACPLGFHGDRCQHAIKDESSCPENRCLNGGVCKKDKCGAARCVCLAGFKGSRCESTTACDQKPCGENGACEISKTSGAGFLCRCRGGWSGRFCDVFRPSGGTNCGSQRYREGNGTVSSHAGYDGRSVYGTDFVCKWTFTAAEKGRVCLQFEAVDLRRGQDWDSHDFLSIYGNDSGDGAPLIRFYPWENPGRFCSRTRQLTLRFQSAKREKKPTSGTGFRLSYTMPCL